MWKYVKILHYGQGSVCRIGPKDHEFAEAFAATTEKLSTLQTDNWKDVLKACQESARPWQAQVSKSENSLKRNLSTCLQRGT